MKSKKGDSKELLISFKGLKKSFGQRAVLEGVDINVYSGEILGIVGMSGCGKTTLLNTLVGFFRPDAGDIMFLSNYLLGLNPRTNIPRDTMISLYENILALKRTFGFAPQKPSYYPGLTVEENLDHFASLYGLPREMRKSSMEELLNLTGLLHARKSMAKDISLGMQKRLGIACALVHRPYVLILDEPTSDLDPILRKQIWELIRLINEKGTTIIFASHFLDEMETVCDRMAVLHEGKIIKHGTPDELKLGYSKSQEIILETLPGDYDSILKALKKSWALPAEKIIVRDGRLVIYTPAAELVLHHILHILHKMKERLVDVDVNKPSLDEVFEGIVKKRGI